MTDIPERPPHFECRSFRASVPDARYLASKTGRDLKDRKPLKLTDTVIRRVQPPHDWQTSYDDYGTLNSCGAPRGTGNASIWFERTALPVEGDLVTWTKNTLSAPAHHLSLQDLQTLQRLLRAVDSESDTIDSAQTFDIDKERVIETKGRSTGPAERPHEVWRFQNIYRALEIPGKGMYLQTNSYIGESTAFLKHQREADECFQSIEWTLDYR
ncbi:MAG TPA: hypothetical protein V6C97_01815 [Oculatellaceae cyanobacterium]